ncbi:phage distal tail protein, partial [Leuconostoc citreum]|nr:phage tail protein [Leuconostoc citreum]
TPNPGYGNGWSWRSTSYDRGGNWDKGAGRVNQPGTITSTVKELMYDAPNIITNLWANFELTKIGNQMHILVKQIAGSGLESGNIVLDYTMTVPDGFNTKVAQIGYFFGKTPIHEDKIVKTTPADGDKPASYQFVQSYQDDRLTVTDLTVQGITTADALKKAHTIVHAGDTATIDTETENVYINGKVANKYLSPASTYPLLKGGQKEDITFFPTPDKATVKYNYRPAMK